MKKNFTIQNVVVTTVRSMDATHKTMSSIKFVWTNVFTLFLMFVFWQTGMGQSVFLPGNPPIIGDAPVGINIPPAPGIDFHVNGNIRFQGLPNITLANSFLAMDVVGNIFHQTGSLPLMGSALGQSLYWSGTHWQPTSFLNVNPGANFVGVGRNNPIGLPQVNSAIGIPGFPLGVPVYFASEGSGEFNGDVTALGDFWNPSDETLKESFHNLTTDWKRILNIPAYSYMFKQSDEFHFSKTKSYGFKAQEVKQYIPELVTHNGKFHLVNYNGFIPFLTQGIQEHENRLNTLERNQVVEYESNKKVENLENENKELKRRLALLEERFNSLCDLPCIQNNSNIDKNESEVNKNFGQIGELNAIPSLEQNEPNPFSETTIIRYFVPESNSNAKIEIRNNENKIVGSFPITQLGKGKISISAGSLSVGNYFYSLVINNKTIDTKKMILLN